MPPLSHPSQKARRGATCRSTSNKGVNANHAPSLPSGAGGPFRFLIPDFAACRTADVDECANVKFVDRIELSQQRGHDNRPADESQHAALHEREAEHNGH